MERFMIIPVILISVISLIAISLSLVIWVRAQKIVNNLKGVTEEIKQMREDSGDLTRIQRELLYLGHQIKTIQFKTNGNSHHRRVHPSPISHS